MDKNKKQHIKQLEEMLRLEECKSALEIIERVHELMDRYVIPLPKGTSWQSFEQTMNSGEGTDDDICLAKYACLIALGIPLDNLMVCSNDDELFLVYYLERHSRGCVIRNNLDVQHQYDKNEILPALGYGGETMWSVMKDWSRQQFPVEEGSRWAQWWEGEAVKV